MKIMLFGATGMVGQGVLRECLVDGDVTRVLCVGRKPSGQQHPKVSELVVPVSRLRSVSSARRSAATRYA